MPLDPLASPRHIAAELRRMADALDPEGAAPAPVVNHYHAPAVGPLDPDTVENIARVARFLTTGDPNESKADRLRRLAEAP